MSIPALQLQVKGVFVLSHMFALPKVIRRYQSC